MCPIPNTVGNKAIISYNGFALETSTVKCSTLLEVDVGLISDSFRVVKESLQLHGHRGPNQEEHH